LQFGKYHVKPAFPRPPMIEECQHLPFFKD